MAVSKVVQRYQVPIQSKAKVVQDQVAPTEISI